MTNGCDQALQGTKTTPNKISRRWQRNLLCWSEPTDRRFPQEKPQSFEPFQLRFPAHSTSVVAGEDDEE